MNTINCNGTLINLSQPKVMGILNITPDSFYDGGKTMHVNTILQQAETMLTEGATFLDIGGYSSRPNAKNITEAEEASRVLPAIQSILKEGDSELSVRYTKTRPDLFKDGAEVIVSGQLMNGTFYADELQTKCASRYEGDLRNENNYKLTELVQ